MEPVIFRPLSGPVVFGVIIFTSWGICFSTLHYDGMSVAAILWTTMITLGSFEIFARPGCVFSPDGVKIKNPFTDFDIPWSEVDDISARYALTFKTRDNREIRAWAATASGRHKSRKIHKSEIKGTVLADRGSLAFGENPNSNSGTGFIIAQHFWREWSKSNSRPRQGIHRSFRRFVALLQALLVFIALSASLLNL